MRTKSVKLSLVIALLLGAAMTVYTLYNKIDIEIMSRNVRPFVKKYKLYSERCYRTVSSVPFLRNPDCNGAMTVKQEIKMIPSENRELSDSFLFAQVAMRNAYIQSMKIHGCDDVCKSVSIAAL